MSKDTVQGIVSILSVVVAALAIVGSVLTAKLTADKEAKTKMIELEFGDRKATVTELYRRVISIGFDYPSVTGDSFPTDSLTLREKVQFLDGLEARLGGLIAYYLENELSLKASYTKKFDAILDAWTKLLESNGSPEALARNPFSFQKPPIDYKRSPQVADLDNEIKKDGDCLDQWTDLVGDMRDDFHAGNF